MQVKKRGFLGFISRMSATSWIVWLSVIISTLGFILWALYPASVDYFALKPSNILAGKYLWTLVVHIFSHGNSLHLFVNMFVLVSLGSLCEKIIGRKRFVWFYLISGVIAGMLSVLLAGFFGYGFWVKLFGTPDTYMVGASGAIFAIAGLFVVLLPRLRFGIIFIPFFSLPGFIMIPLVLILTWLATYFAGLPIGNVSHLGGFLSGMVYGFYLRTKYKKKVMMIQRIFR